MTEISEQEHSQAANDLSPLEVVVEPTYCAYVDNKGVYQGMVIMPPKDQITAQHLAHITRCDLAVGQYVWDSVAQSFVPIKSRSTLNTAAVDAIESGIKLLLRNNQDIPLEVLAWVAQLKKA